ncbi:lysis protein [Pseudomonas putida]
MTGLDWRLAALALLLGLAVGGRSAWLWQANTYTAQLATQAADFDKARDSASREALATLQAEQAERAALEQRLRAQSTTHYKELKDAQKARQRLADRLATADLRLSVLVANPAAGAGGNGGVPAATAAGCLVHGAARVELDPAHAQRIIAITGDGDDGLKALEACQGYVREITGAGHSSK